MKFHYYGTAAAEGVPSMFGCGCEVCKIAREVGGRHIRTRSQAAVDGRLLIDFPPDTCAHVLYGGLDLGNISSCIITHDHSDHFYLKDLQMRAEWFSTPEFKGPLTVYGTRQIGDLVNPFIENAGLDKQGRVAFKEVQPFVRFEADEYGITPLKAAHGDCAGAVIYLIEKDNKSILYGNDTAYFPEETWSYFAEVRPYINFVSLDCTFGFREDTGTTHMNFGANLEVRARLEELGCADNNSRYCAHHFSHNGKTSYDEMVKAAEEKGFLVSYDGMEVDI